LVTVTRTAPPSHALGMPVSRTAVTVLLEIVKFVTTPVRLPQDVTAAEPTTSPLLVGVIGRASTEAGTSVNTATASTHAKRRVAM
jgi:hypothetical protein